MKTQRLRTDTHSWHSQSNPLKTHPKRTREGAGEGSAEECAGEEAALEALLKPPVRPPRPAAPGLPSCQAAAGVAGDSELAGRCGCRRCGVPSASSPEALAAACGSSLHEHMPGACQRLALTTGKVRRAPVTVPSGLQ